jgi:hypothetical protein
VRVLANGVECVRGVVTAVPMPETMSPGGGADESSKSTR